MVRQPATSLTISHHTPHVPDAVTEPNSPSPASTLTYISTASSQWPSGFGTSYLKLWPRSPTQCLLRQCSSSNCHQEPCTLCLPEVIITGHSWGALTAHLRSVLSINSEITHVYKHAAFKKKFILVEVTYLVIHRTGLFYQHRMDYFIPADYHGLFYPAPLHLAPEWHSRGIMPHGSGCSLARPVLM